MHLYSPASTPLCPHLHIRMPRPLQDRRRRKEAARAAQMNRRYVGDGDSQHEPRRSAPDSSRASSPRRSAYVPPLRNLECATLPTLPLPSLDRPTTASLSPIRTLQTHVDVEGWEVHGVRCERCPTLPFARRH
jgi:hypothetical protein